MMEDDFNNLLSAVADVFDVPKSEILKKFSHKTYKARCFLCYMIYHEMPHIRRTLLQEADISKTAYYKAERSASEMIEDSIDDMCLMNEIREKVFLPKLKKSISRRDRISDTKTLFGFDYTESDIIRRRSAIISSGVYMQKLCKIGREPIPDGMVFSPLRPYRDCKSWYND